MTIGPIEESFAMMNRYGLVYSSSDSERVDGLTYAWRKVHAQVGESEVLLSAYRYGAGYKNHVTIERKKSLFLFSLLFKKIKKEIKKKKEIRNNLCSCFLKVVIGREFNVKFKRYFIEKNVL